MLGLVAKRKNNIKRTIYIIIQIECILVDTVFINILYVHFTSCLCKGLKINKKWCIANYLYCQNTSKLDASEQDVYQLL